MFRNLAPVRRKRTPDLPAAWDGAMGTVVGAVLDGATPPAGSTGDGAAADPLAHTVVAAYQRLAPVLHRYLFVRTGSVQDAEDLVMEVFVQAWRHRFSVEKPDPWLFTVAKHAADRFGRRHRRDAPLDDVADVAAAETRWDDLDPGSPVIVAFFALREADRVILLLHGCEGRPIAEVAAVLGIREDAAWKRWDRARTRFFDVLLAVGVTPPNKDRWARVADRAGASQRDGGERHDEL